MSSGGSDSSLPVLGVSQMFSAFETNLFARVLLFFQLRDRKLQWSLTQEVMVSACRPSSSERSATPRPTLSSASITLRFLLFTSQFDKQETKLSAADEHHAELCTREQVRWPTRLMYIFKWHVDVVCAEMLCVLIQTTLRFQCFYVFLTSRIIDQFLCKLQGNDDDAFIKDLSHYVFLRNMFWCFMLVFCWSSDLSRSWQTE